MPKKIAVNGLWPLVKKTLDEWTEDKVPKMSAALAYYTAISMAPLLVITIKVIGVILGPKAAQNQLQDQLGHLTDPHIADALQDAIKKAGQPGNGSMAAIFSLIIALFGASGVFGELQDSLNTIWEVRPKPNRGIWGIVQDRFLSMTMVLGCAFLLLVTMAISTTLTNVSNGMIGSIFGGSGVLVHICGIVIDLVISTAVVSVIFAAIFKVLPDAEISWRDVWLGAVVTAVLFQIGKYGLSIYLTKASPASAYGAAGSIVAVLLWACYSSYILFFGAEFTQVYANQYGTRIVPSKNAEPLTEEMRAQAGIPHDKPATASAHGRRTRATDVPSLRPRPAASKQKSHQGCRVIRPNRRTHLSAPLPHESYVIRYLPVLAGVVVGRFFWKRHHELTPTPATLQQRWINAARDWKKLMTMFRADASTRYALTHGPRGREGPSWIDLEESATK